MSNIKNGQRPLSQKRATKPAKLTFDDLFDNRLGIDPEVAAEIAADGKAYRFISVPQLQKNGGAHEKGWKPFKRKSGTMDTLFGGDPDGLIRRGDLVLAVRPLELHQKHKQYLKQEATEARAMQSRQLREAREIVQGVDGIQMHEGFEDKNETTEDDND